MQWLLRALGLEELFDFTATSEMAYKFGIVPSDSITRGWVIVIFVGLIIINVLNVKEVKRK